MLAYYKRLALVVGEVEALDLVCGWIFAAKDVTEKEAIAASTTGGNDFATVFHDDIGLIEFKGSRSAD